MKVDRYVFGELLRPSLLGLAFYTFVLVMNQLFLVVTQAFQRGTPPAVIFELILLALPKILVLTIPMALLFGTLIGLGRLSADSEIVALRAAGVSYGRLVRPVVTLGVAGFAVSALVYNLAVPWSTGVTQDLRVELFRTSDPNREIQAGVFYSEIPDTLVYAEQVDRTDAQWPLRNVLIHSTRLDSSWARPGEQAPGDGSSQAADNGDQQPTGEAVPEGRSRKDPARSAADKGAPTGRVAAPPAARGERRSVRKSSPGGSAPEPAGEELSAEPPPSEETFVSGSRGRIEVSRDGTQARFFVDRGEIHRSDPQSPELYRRVRFDSPFMTVVPLATSDILTGERKRSVQEYTLPELLEEARHFKPKRYPGHPDRVYRYRVALMEIHWRFAVPAAAIAFCLLGFPLGLVNTRGGKSSGFAVSLVVITLYWIALTIGRDLAIEGKLPPFAGAWGPGLLLLGAALAFLALRRKAGLLGMPGTVRGWLGTLPARLSSGVRRSASRREGSLFPARVSPPPPAPRILIPVLDRYIARRYLLVFVLVLLSTASLYAVVEVRSFADSLIQRSLPLTMALKYLVYFTPGMLKVIMPIASVVAALITLGILCRANEDTAMKAAGVSIFRISLPILLVTAILCGCYFVIQDYVAPWTNQRAAQLRDEIEGRVSSVAIGGTRWLFGKDHRLYGYGEYEPDRKLLQDVSVLELKDDPFRIRKRLWAPRVEWRGDSWVAPAGWTRGFKGDEEPYAALSDTPLKWAETPDDFARHERSLVQSGRLAEELNFVELRRHIRRMKNSGYDTTRLRVSLYEKLAFPVAPLVMVLIGLPFAFRAGRRGSLYGMGIALLLVILYWSTFAVTSALGHEQILPPLLAAWAPNLLFTLTGGYLLLSTRS